MPASTGPLLGAPAPDFSLPISATETLTLAALRGRSVVLYFYPKDDTPGCTVESNDFRDRLPAFTRAGAVVIGVSKDSLASHAKFAAKHCLPFPLGSDEAGTVCEAYRVWTEKTMYGKRYMGIERSTFLIDRAGILRQEWRKVTIDGHADAVLRAVQAV